MGEPVAARRVHFGEQTGRVLLLRTKPARPTKSGSVVVRLARQELVARVENILIREAIHDAATRRRFCSLIGLIPPNW